MVELNFDAEGEALPCEGCGTPIPAFLDACPYCDDDEDEVFEDCPKCAAPIYDNSEQCPRCRAWVTMAHRPAAKTNAQKGSSKKIFIAVLVITLLILGLMKLAEGR